LPEELRLLFVVAYHVGLRKGALLRIKWSQVDMAASCIWMEGKRPNRKPEPVAVPIYGDMAKFLADQPRESEYLFARGSKPIRDFRARWNQACDEAGVPSLLFHDLRRTAVRNLRRAGVVMRRSRCPRRSQDNLRLVSRIPGGRGALKLSVDDAGWDRILACIGNGGIPRAGGTRKSGFGAPGKSSRAIFAFYSPRPPLGSLTKEMG
jgi:hypothetical protein